MGAPILVAGANFGCGSSREHAVWALQQIGLKAIVAPSFGEIFENNALRNGLIPVRLAAEVVEALLALAPEDWLEIDVAAQVVLTPAGTRLAFPIDPFRKRCLAEGLDEIDVTRDSESAIFSFERKALEERPWLRPGWPVDP